jgi:nucleoside-diphosphate-sugar epimerase
MRVLFTGATGVIGRRAVPRLVGAGHDVVGLSRTDEGKAWLKAAGAEAVDIDLLDEEAVRTATREIDVVAHFATNIPPLASMVKDGAWAENDALRDTATGLLVDAALANEVGRFIQESITFFYADGGDQWLNESAPIDPSFRPLASAMAAEGHVERFRQGGGTGVTLRLTRLYGPGDTSREYIQAVRKRDIPVAGKGNNYVSSLHIGDAGSAVLTGVTAPDGTYNVSDDEPVRSAVYVEKLAEVLGASRPRRLPRSAVKLALGRSAGLLVTSQRVSNRKFRETTGWAPKHPSVVEGWPTVLNGP